MELSFNFWGRSHCIDTKLTHEVRSHHVQMALGSENRGVAFTAGDLLDDNVEAAGARDWDIVGSAIVDT